MSSDINPEDWSSLSEMKIMKFGAQIHVWMSDAITR